MVETTAARLLLLLSLFQSRREWPGAALAQRLAVSPRTVRRDVERLRALGYPVHVTKGPGGAYRLGAGARLPPLLFDDDQALAIAVALQTAPVTVAGIAEAADRALATIRQVLPTSLRHRIDAVRVTAIDNAWDFAAPPVAPDLLLALGTAIRHHSVLTFAYASATPPPDPTPTAPPVTAPPPSEAASTGPAATAPPPSDPPPSHPTAVARRVEPHQLAVWSGRWYLLAWDIGRGAWAAFRVDRIALGPATAARFTPRPLPSTDPTAFITGELDRGDTPDHWPCRGQVLLDAPAAVIARWAPGGALVEKVGPNRCRLTLGAWSWTGLAALFGTFGSDIEVVGPRELATACATLARRYAAASRCLPDPAAGRAPDPAAGTVVRE
ncbi:helix-turn-helix transcriptional regulator [Streptomyces buecherae]|uniref:helix-turn-helix transcriptional regulator n=1 Tax=Streptomyces buecherae TaxID=2763006 RepID=UPI00164D7A0E|nr:WYL domain-containing protein [Streptomyces buecherae]QNJ39599.1 WYL domain-containing protein [Streptomyces buecherae]